MGSEARAMIDRLPLRFQTKIAVDPTGCWLWAGATMWNGYGQATPLRSDPPGTTTLVHRRAYEILVGPIPDGMTLDHLCRVRECVNPDHMEPVTMRDNMLRGRSPAAYHARATHCPKGHPYFGANLYQRPNGSRGCRACLREQKAAYKRRRR
jgi:hypothetical protein